ncbi:CNH-domain-containing protein [Trametes cingulata]|nr:CNH-domain-containing protein [Trametes cingulata]
MIKPMAEYQSRGSSAEPSTSTSIRVPRDARLSASWYAERLEFKDTSTVVDLGLTDPERQVLHAGPLFRQTELSPLKRTVSGGGAGWKQLWVVLFDNYLVMTKQKGQGADSRYVVWKPPVRLEFLALESLSIRPVQRSNTLSRMMRRSESPGPGRISPDPSLSFSLSPFDPSSSSSDAYYPLSFHTHGKHAGSYTLYAASAEDRAEWRRRLREALAARRAAQEAGSIFRLETITRDTAESQEAPAHAEGLVTGRVACTLPFGMSDGRHFIAIGSEDGVWVGMPHQPQSIQRVMSLKLVTQIAYLVEYGLLVVLADKVLYAIDIESVIPSSAHPTKQPAFGLQTISNPHHPVHFFSVGRLGGRTLITYKKRKGLDSVFRLLRVFRPTEQWESQDVPKVKVDREFFLPSDAHDLLFLKTKVCILCTRGFEIMDLTDFSSATIPLEDDLRRLGKRSSACKPIAMFRIREDEFLLCYDEFGLYVDKRGAPSRSPPTIEWEGVATQAAWHAPYVLLFCSSFIEVRHVESGRLAQIISGQDVRCLWDGRGVVHPEVQGADIGGFHDFDDPRTPRIHAVMDDSEISSFASAGNGVPRRQHVVELVPTERLVVPGTRYSPSLLSLADTLPPYTP